MAITSVGYAGTVGDAQWAGMISRVGGAVYSVDDYASFRVAVAAGTRALSVAAGKASAFGVYDTSSAVESVSLDSVSSGNRWDLVVLRRTWATKVTSIVVIPGGSTKVLPARTVNPGTVVDQPLALARVIAGSTVVQEVVDLRCITGDGGLLAWDDLARSYLTQVGTSVRIGDTVWDRVTDASGSPIWVSSLTDDTGWVTLPRGTGWDAVAGYPTQIRAVGQMVYARGAVKAGAGADLGSLAIAPTAFRPTSDTPLGATVTSSKAYGELLVQASGTLWVPDGYRVGSVPVGANVMIHGAWMKG